MSVSVTVQMDVPRYIILRRIGYGRVLAEGGGEGELGFNNRCAVSNEKGSGDGEGYAHYRL